MAPTQTKQWHQYDGSSNGPNMNEAATATIRRWQQRHQNERSDGTNINAAATAPIWKKQQRQQYELSSDGTNMNKATMAII